MALCFKKSVQLLEYAHDIDIIGRIKRDVTAAFSVIERESTKMGLAVNGSKTKYMLSISRDVRHIDSQITADNYTFDKAKDFINLAPTLPQKMMSVGRSNVRPLLPTNATMVSMGNIGTGTFCVRRT